MNSHSQKSQKKHLRRKAFRLWIQTIGQNKAIYLAGVFTVFITNLMQVYTTRTTGQAIDLLAKPYSELIKQDFLFLLAKLFGGLLLLFMGRVGWRLTLARQTHKVARDLRALVWDNARFFPKALIDETFTKGVLLNASNSDVSAAKFLFGFTLVGITDFSFLTSITLTAMFSLHAKLAFFCLLAMLPLPYVMKRISEKEIKLYEKSQETLSEFNDLTAQAVASIRLQRLTQTGVFWKKRLIQMAYNYANKRLKAVEGSLRWFPAMGALSLITSAILFGMGLWYVRSGEMTLGEFIAMQGLVYLLQDPMTELGFIISDWQKGMASLTRLCEIADGAKEEHLVSPIDTMIGRLDGPILSVKNFTVRFKEQKPLFSNFNLVINKGDRIGIYGPIGSGKSVLAMALSGLSHNYEGQILFLGRPYTQYNHLDLRNFIGFVSQSPFLFASSVRENIIVGSEKFISDEEIWKAIEIAGLKEDVEQFPDGLATELGEWGINLSGGQKQRMSLARALVRKPQLLFLDDCLSAVDTVTEEKILKAIDLEMMETTLVWIAHRPSTLKYCHRLLALGDIKEIGHGQ